ncbi:heptaprenylglyceryl phosphate synthase [Texcoconibacillus texcoconensis]|uniref:Heptaprenylglyceryl phosphate synthase n=1 Tax=Texcoconibacillus texcoconensis TaxID=1095777 RepID=A0A840QMI5_9BACI|nr:putative glycerol-1-phosphate prenyltransferase [Texcoconibacillus texcoconensis]
MLEYHQWRHVFKLDPNKSISDEALEKVCESGTDAIIIGGSDGVTEDNTLDLLLRVRRYSVACALEISSLEALTPGYDYYLVPSVLNAGDLEWVVGKQHEALKAYGELIEHETLLAEGYCVLNKEAKVAERTKANTELDREDVEAYARLADQIFRMPIVYIEYSGGFGEPDIVKQVSRVVESAKVFYGGGITSVEEAKTMAHFADTIVVGNVIYDDLKAALKTVQAVKETAS